MPTHAWLLNTLDRVLDFRPGWFSTADQHGSACGLALPTAMSHRCDEDGHGGSWESARQDGHDAIIVVQKADWRGGTAGFPCGRLKRRE